MTELSKVYFQAILPLLVTALNVTVVPLANSRLHTLPVFLASALGLPSLMNLRMNSRDLLTEFTPAGGIL